jgi:formylglycine-generating enzyme required for sulfatase activity
MKQLQNMLRTIRIAPVWRFGLILSLGVLFLGACSNPFINEILGDKKSSGNASGREYLIRVDPSKKDHLMAKPEKAVAGTIITVLSSSPPGQRLVKDSLKFQDNSGVSHRIDEEDRTFIMPPSDVEITAEFEDLEAGNFSISVTIADLQHGIITARPEFGKEGDVIDLYIRADLGYRLKPGSLCYTNAPGDPGLNEPIDELSHSLFLPVRNIMICAEFEALQGDDYSVSVGNMINGRLYPLTNHGPAGTEITVLVKPDFGYRLKEKTLSYTGAFGKEDIDDYSRTFSMPASHVLIDAEFEALSAGLYSVSAEATPYGQLIPRPDHGSPGTTIHLIVIPNPGYKLADGSLKYNDVPDDGSRSFTLGSSHVRVSGKFEALGPGLYTAAASYVPNGRIVVAPEYGPAGTEIQVSLFPDSRYRLKANSLKYRHAGGLTNIDEETKKFSLPPSHVRVTGDFRVPYYRVKVPSLVNGGISADPVEGPEGTEITLTIKPAPDYALKAGTLKYEDSSGEQAIDEKTKKFSLPAEDVSVKALFVSTNTALKSLTVDGKPVGGLARGKTAYTAWVRNNIDTAEIRAEAEHKAAVLDKSRITLENLRIFDNTAAFEVTAEDGITKTVYTINVVREYLLMIDVQPGAFQRDNAAANISRVSGFAIGESEVTRAQWLKIMDSPSPSLVLPDSDPEITARLPVENITWYNGLQFCNALSLKEGKTPVYSANGSHEPARLDGAAITTDWTANGYRLPTEMEWLWAAMGADTYDPGKVNTRGYTQIFAGQYIPLGRGEFGWTINNNERNRTHPVKELKPNELKLYDMTGNVSEWCWDYYADFPSGGLQDYRGLVNSSLKVIRGGSFMDDAMVYRFGARLQKYQKGPGWANYTTGLRVAGQ